MAAAGRSYPASLRRWPVRCARFPADRDQLGTLRELLSRREGSRGSNEVQAVGSLDNFWSLGSLVRIRVSCNFDPETPQMCQIYFLCCWLVGIMSLLCKALQGNSHSVGSTGMLTMGEDSKCRRWNELFFPAAICSICSFAS